MATRAYFRTLQRSFRASLLAAALGLLFSPSVHAQTAGLPAYPAVSTGDANCDGALDVSDAVAALNHMFLGQAACCQANIDVDNNKALDLSDAVRLLNFLFKGQSLTAPDGTRLETARDGGPHYYDAGDVPFSCSLLPPEYAPVPTWGYTTANVRDSKQDVLLFIPGLGGVRDTGVPGELKLEFYSDGAVVESSIQHKRNINVSGVTDNYLQIEVRPWVSMTEQLPFPHHTSFLATIYRGDKIGWLYGRENDGILSVMVAATDSDGNALPSSVIKAVAFTGDPTPDTLLDIPGLGGVRDTGIPGKNRQLEIYSSGRVVEWAVQHGRDQIPGVTPKYQQGEVMPNQTTIVDFPHHTSFAINVARHAQTGWLFGRENDNVLSMIGASSGSLGRCANVGSQTIFVGDGNVDTLIDVPGLGGVRDTGNPSQNRQLEIYSGGQVVEWALQHARPRVPGEPDQYEQGEVQRGSAATVVTFPHHTSFLLNIARHGQNAWVFARENDNRLTAVYATTR